MLAIILTIMVALTVATYFVAVAIFRAEERAMTRHSQVRRTLSCIPVRSASHHGEDDPSNPRGWTDLTDEERWVLKMRHTMIASRPTITHVVTTRDLLALKV